MAIAIVQHKPATASNTAVTLAVTVTATGTGNLLAVWAANGGTRTVSGVSDGTNNFSQVSGCAGTGVGGIASDIWYLPVSTSGKTTITVTYSGSVGASFDKDLEFWEVSGFTLPTVDGTGGHVNNGVAASSTDTGATVTTGASAGFIAAGVRTSLAVTANPKSGNEFTSGGDITAFSNAGCSLISSSAAGHTPTWTDTTGADFVSSTGAFMETPTSNYVPHDLAHSMTHQMMVAQ